MLDEYINSLQNDIINSTCELIKIPSVSTTKISEDKSKHVYNYEATLDLKSGGNFGYTFRVMPKHKMLIDCENMNLIKWITK